MKKKILTIVQIGITVGVLCWIFRDPKFRADLLKALSEIDPTWLIVALFLGVVPMICGVLRWHCLLKVQGFELSLKRVGAITFIGAFFNLFLLGSTGGDVLKAWYLFQEAPKRKTIGFLTIIMDRLIGLLALIAISLVVIVTRYAWLTQSPVAANLLWLLIFFLSSSLGAVVVSLFVTGFQLQHKLPKKLPGREMIIELASAYEIYAKSPVALIIAFCLSLVSHMVFFAIFFLAGLAFNAHVPFLDMVAVMPVIAVISSLPVSLSGIGVREGLFKEMLGSLCHVKPELAVLISTFGFLIVVCWSLIGGLIFLFYKPSTATAVSLSAMQQDIEEVEHRVTDDDNV